jgi:hypothetical protein
MKPAALIIIASLLAASSLRTVAQDTNAAAAPEQDSFKFIAEKNIFDPNRTGRTRYRRGGPQRHVERVSLVGTTVDNGSAAAFFAGDGVPDKPLKSGDEVKDFRISQITEDGVRLVGATNTFVLDFEGRRSLRREEKGPWQGSTDISEPVAASEGNGDEPAPAAHGSAPPAGGSGESDIIKRLRLKREQEEK